MKTDRYLLDTNILLRFKNKADKDHETAVNTIRKLLQSEAVLHSCAQNMIEYRVVATRPIENNGYALTSTEVAQDIAAHEAVFPILLDSAANTDIYLLWRKLVEDAGTLGKANHDARILAAANAHGCTHLLTFNDRDFVRYATVVPHVAIINPNDLPA